MTSKKLIVPAILSFLFSCPLFAITTIPCKKSSTQAFYDIVEKVKIIGPTDDRMTFETYAERKSLPTQEVEKKFEASGLLDCGSNKQISAQLTGSNGVITTARHFFKNHVKGCVDERLSTCSFYTFLNGKTQKHSVDVKSLKMGACGPKSGASDWAVLKLKNPAKNIKPFGIPSYSGRPEVGKKIINPAAYADNFRVNGDKPRTITECEVRHHFSFMQTDCDTGPGSSGSANLVEEGNELTLVGIQVMEHYNEDRQPFDKQRSFSGSAVLEGEFYDAVKEAVGTTRTASKPDDDI